MTIYIQFILWEDEPPEVKASSNIFDMDSDYDVHKYEYNPKTHTMTYIKTIQGEP